jgi:hypothetical protein
MKIFSFNYFGDGKIATLRTVFQKFGDKESTLKVSYLVPNSNEYKHED